MDLLKALILGIVQGLTEFLPVSSSGHLEIFKVLLGTSYLESESLFLTVVLHFATAVSTLIVFRKDVAEILTNSLKQNDEGGDARKFIAYIALSMIPAALIGVFFMDWIEDFFSGNLLFVGLMLIVTALLLFLADRAKNTNKSVKALDSIIVGISQALAILPGISRSGATISTSVLLKIDRTKAARFSFLMVVPLILAKIAKDIISGDFAEMNIPWSVLIVGFTAALLTGIVACRWMIKIVKNSKLSYFAIYCILVGSIAIGSSLIW